MERSSRKGLLAGFAVAAALVMLSSAAFACTVYRGKITVVGVTGATGTQTAIGSNNGMRWCKKAPAWVMNTPANASATISISTTSAVCGGFTGQLRNGTYTVGLARGFMGQGGSPHINCHSSQATSTSIGTYTVGDGQGGATEAAESFTYTTNSSVGYDNICVYGNNSADANDININVI